MVVFCDFDIVLKLIYMYGYEFLEFEFSQLDAFLISASCIKYRDAIA